MRTVIPWRSSCTCLLAAVLGWSAPVFPQDSQKLPSGIATIEEAREDLANRLEKRREVMRIAYYGIPSPYPFASPEAKSRFSQAYPQVREILVSAGFFSIHTRGARVLQDGIDFPARPLFFEELPNFDIAVKNGDVVLSHSVMLRLESLSMADARRIADDLLFIQRNVESDQDRKEAAFRGIAARYRARTTGPAMTEVQRRLVVQANALTQGQDYMGAIDRYRQVLADDPVTYPTAYYNMALLFAELRLFKSAIRHMHRYLLLVPDANDARAAQDKIYEWEMLAERK